MAREPSAAALVVLLSAPPSSRALGRKLVLPGASLFWRRICSGLPFNERRMSEVEGNVTALGFLLLAEP